MSCGVGGGEVVCVVAWAEVYVCVCDNIKRSRNTIQ